MMDNNEVMISGEIVTDFAFAHEVYGEKFYKAELSALRGSKVADVVPILVSERLADMKENWKGRNVKISGQFRSYNKHESGRTRLILSVFAREFEEMGKEEDLPFPDDENYIFLDGYICKETKYRKTPLGREITDMIVAINRPYGKSDYIPCIVWGRNARFAENLKIGTHISLEGRIQSREYQKRINDEEFETRVAYEVSVSKIEVIEEKEG